MSIEIKVPVLPESVADATIATWHKQPGEFVKRDEVLVDIETDKVVLEVVAPDDGQITKIRHQTGETVLGEAVIGDFEAGKAPEQDEAQAKETSAAAMVSAGEAEKADEPTQVAARSSTTDIKAGPAVRRSIQSENLDVNAIVPSGPKGRITREDLTHSSNTTLSVMSERESKRVPMTRLRARVAERLVEAQQTAAILTTFNDVNMKPVMDLRQKYKDDFEKKHGTRLGFMSFFVKAVIKALQEYPVLNASVDGQDIVYHNYQDIGVAVSSPRGLVVPVIQNAEKLSMAQIEASIRDFGERAGKAQLTLEEITGGTFTISNGGVFGSLLSTPILNPPQVGILGMHKIQDRPIVENNEIVIRPMMNLALSYDHRIIDGSEAVQFLVNVKTSLEDPARFLLDI